MTEEAPSPQRSPASDREPQDLCLPDQGRSRPKRRVALPAPPEPHHEGPWQRLRRKARRKTIQLADWLINRLYHLIDRVEKLAPVEQRYFRVAIFGSSRLEPRDQTYEDVRELASHLSFMGCDIVTGGGPGLMTAANEGAREGAYRFKTRSFGLTILLPMEEQPNPFLDEVAQHKTFFSRLHQFIRLSHAYIVVDGGIGTTLEAMMVWQLIQVRLLDKRPLVFVGPMWRGLKEWVEDDIVARGLASPGDTDLPCWVDTMDEALELVREARNRFLERHEVLLPPPVDRQGEHLAAEEMAPERGRPAGNPAGSDHRRGQEEQREQEREEREAEPAATAAAEPGG